MLTYKTCYIKSPKDDMLSVSMFIMLSSQTGQHIASVCVYLDSSEHASGGDTEVQVGQGVGVGRFIQQRRFLLWQIV